MKAIAIMILCAAMTACAVDVPNASTATDEQGLVCDPNCDPGGQQSTVVALYNLGQAFGYQTAPAWCRYQWQDDQTVYVCSGLFADDGGNQTVVWCNNGDGVHCYWWNCGSPGEPDCHL